MGLRFTGGSSLQGRQVKLPGPGGDSAGAFVYRSHMDSYKVTDEGGGIIRVDAEARLVRKPFATALCAEVDERVAEAGYREFKILMNMSAMAKGTPAAGFYVLRSMKKYPLSALAIFGANGFMRGMAKTVLGVARFGTFDLFQEEAIARDWLERAEGAPGTARLAPDCPATTGRLRRLALPAGLLASGAVVLRVARRRRRAVA